MPADATITSDETNPNDINNVLPDIDDISGAPDVEDAVKSAADAHTANADDKDADGKDGESGKDDDKPAEQPPAGVSPEQFAQIQQQLKEANDKITALSTAKPADQPKGDGSGGEGKQVSAEQIQQKAREFSVSQVRQFDPRIKQLLTQGIADGNAEHIHEALTAMCAETLTQSVLVAQAQVSQLGGGVKEALKKVAEHIQSSQGQVSTQQQANQIQQAFYARHPQLNVEDPVQRKQLWGMIGGIFQANGWKEWTQENADKAAEIIKKTLPTQETPPASAGVTQGVTRGGGTPTSTGNPISEIEALTGVKIS